jgi:hypothetical protein
MTEDLEPHQVLLVLLVLPVPALRAAAGAGRQYVWIGGRRCRSIKLPAVRLIHLCDLIARMQVEAILYYTRFAKPVPFSSYSWSPMLGCTTGLFRPAVCTNHKLH